MMQLITRCRLSQFNDLMDLESWSSLIYDQDILDKIEFFICSSLC
uniref:Uncharacterized protein n=1 Tax=Rhizophora mucronata TaxID=61149 RepID=A0A2P2QMI5_RHIMU